MADDGPSKKKPSTGKCCDQCGKPAVVTEVTVKGGKKVERKLCADCAREEGISVQSSQPLEQIMSSILLAQQQKHDEASEAQAQQEEPVAETQRRPSLAKRCAGCGMTFAEFRSKGLLGCADCYRHFERALGPLIQRSHGGAERHTGKVPRRAGEAFDRMQRLAELRRELADALESEAYEQAAALRDEIRAIERGPAAGASEGA